MRILLCKPYNSVSESIVIRNLTDLENAVTGAYSYMIKNGGAGGYGSEFVIDTEIMTDNLILSKKVVSLMQMVLDYNLFRTVLILIIIVVLIVLLRLQLEFLTV